MHIWESLSAQTNLCGLMYSDSHIYDSHRRCKYNIYSDFETWLIISLIFSHLCVLLSQILICTIWGKELGHGRKSYFICRGTLCRKVVLWEKSLSHEKYMQIPGQWERRLISNFKWELISAVHGIIVLVVQGKASPGVGSDMLSSAVFCPWS